MQFKTKWLENIVLFWLTLFINAMISIFYLLLLGAKLDFIPLIGSYFKYGKNRDFTREWYQDLGSVYVFRMLLMVISPIKKIIQTKAISKLKELKFRFRPFSTDSKTMWQYYQIILQSEFQHELIFEELGMVLLMAFMFGQGIPIMMPIAFIYIFLNEFCFRAHLAYQCRAPIKIDNEINYRFI